MKILFARSCVSVALLAVLLPFSALAAPTPEAISLVRKFVAEELHGNLDALADFAGILLGLATAKTPWRDVLLQMQGRATGTSSS